MKNFVLILLFSIYSFANSFVPLMPIYNEEEKKLSFKLLDNKDIIFDKITSFTKEIETRDSKNFPKSKYEFNTSNNACKELTFKHRRAIREGSFFYTTYSEIAFRKYDNNCSEEKFGNITFIECKSETKNQDNNKFYTIVYDDNEVVPTQSTGLIVQKKCFVQLKNKIK